MPLQDFTPELRTRLSRIERMVGWFVGAAVLLLIAGLAFYIYDTAKNRGWFVTKLNYATALNDFTGFKIGNPVKLMGFDVGEITQFNLNSPEKANGITIFFNVRDPYYKYIWYDSHIRVVSDLLGNRYLEVTKGQFGVPSVTTNHSGKLVVLNRYMAWQKYRSLTNQLRSDPAYTNLTLDGILIEATNQLMTLIKDNFDTYYTNAFQAKYNQPANPDSPPGERNYYWISAMDTPSIQDRLTAVATQVQLAMPGILNMTNQLNQILSNANRAVARLDNAIAQTEPILRNVNTITGHLQNPNGALGDWLVPTALASQLHDTLDAATETLKSAHTTLDSTDTNVTMLATDLDKTLQHLADLTSNLAWQVSVNTNMLTDISTTIVHTDDLIQGLKREWFLRGAFKKKKPPEAKEPEKTPAFPRP